MLLQRKSLFATFYYTLDIREKVQKNLKKNFERFPFVQFLNTDTARISKVI